MTDNKNLSEKFPITVEQIAFGVRFQPCYRMFDNIGTIIDQVLRFQGSPFGPNIFPLINRETREQMLWNPDTQNSLRLTESNVILDMLVDTTNPSDIKNLAVNFNTYVLNHFHTISHLEDILRYGVLFRLKECSSSLKETPINHFIQKDFTNVRSLSMRFTKRLPVMEALVRKNVDDYINIIYTVKQTEKNEISIWVDYQEIFKPELNAKEWFSKPFPDFITRGITYLLGGEFQNWLAINMGMNNAEK